MARHRRRGRERERSTQGGILLPSPEVGDSSATSSADDTPATSEVSSPEQGVSYFDQFEGFHEDPDASFAEVFSSLAIYEGWSKPEKKQRRFKAVEAEIDRYLGTDMTDLEIWQKICAACGLEPDLPSITKCKKALATIHVNIYDFIEHCRHPDRVSVRTFSSLTKLRKYSVPNFIFPLGRAKADKFTKVFLRPFFHHGRK